MATNAAAIPYRSEATSMPQGLVVLLGRLLFAAVFLMSSLGHFSKQTIAFAASQGVPLASVMVPLSGTLALAAHLIDNRGANGQEPA